MLPSNGLNKFEGYVQMKRLMGLNEKSITVVKPEVNLTNISLNIPIPPKAKSKPRPKPSKPSYNENWESKFQRETGIDATYLGPDTRFDRYGGGRDSGERNA